MGIISLSETEQGKFKRFLLQQLESYHGLIKMMRNSDTVDAQTSIESYEKKVESYKSVIKDLVNLVPVKFNKKMN